MAEKNKTLQIICRAFINCNQAKQYLYKFNKIKKKNCYWLLSEREWWFNGGKRKNLLAQLKYGYKSCYH